MKLMIGPELAHNPKLTMDKVTKGPLMDNGALGSAYNTELHEFVGLSIIHAPFDAGLDTKYEPMIHIINDNISLSLLLYSIICIPISITLQKIADIYL